jgi:hypothetical protein
MSEIIKIKEEIDRLIFFLDEKNWPKLCRNGRNSLATNDKIRRKWLKGVAEKAAHHADNLQRALDIVNGRI